MSTLISSLTATDAESSPAARFTSLGRIAAAGTLVVGAAFQVAAFLTMPDLDDTGERLRWIHDHAARAETSKVFDVLAMPFLLGGVIVYVLLARERSPKLAWAGGILLGLGLVGLTASQGFETLEFAIATDGRFDLGTLADFVDNVSTAPVIVMLLMFLPGVLLGIFITSAALWRSRAVPRGAVVLLPVFIVVDVALSQPLVAHVIALVGATWIATAILRAPQSQPRPG